MMQVRENAQSVLQCMSKYALSLYLFACVSVEVIHEIQTFPVA